MHDVRGAPSPGAGVEKKNTAVHGLRQPAEGLRLGQPGAAVEGTLARVGVPGEMIAVIRKFHDS